MLCQRLSVDRVRGKVPTVPVALQLLAQGYEGLHSKQADQCSALVLAPSCEALLCIVADGRAARTQSRCLQQAARKDAEQLCLPAEGVKG